MRIAGYTLLLCMLALMGLGLVVITSIGDVQGGRLFGDPDHFWHHQLLFGVVALGVCAVVAAVPTRLWFRREVAWAIVALSLFGLVAVHLPGIGRTANGSARWIRLPGLLVQPSEFIKVGSMVVLAAWTGARGRNLSRFREGALVPALWIGAVVFGLLLEPDLGSSLMLAFLSGVVLYLAGTRFWHLVLLAVVAAVALGGFLLTDANRMHRVTSVVARYLHGGGRDDASTALSQHDKNEAYQVEMGLAAFRAGGVRGVGLGRSLFKQRYLPENHTDFIFAMVGEELGLVATTACLLLFLAMACAGFYLAYRAPDASTFVLAAGLSLQLCFSAAVNVAVVTGIAPTKGLAMPFLSYGGSSLIVCAATVGFLLGIAFRPGAPRVPALPDDARCLPATDLWND